MRTFLAAVLTAFLLCGDLPGQTHTFPGTDTKSRQERIIHSMASVSAAAPARDAAKTERYVDSGLTGRQATSSGVTSDGANGLNVLNNVVGSTTVQTPSINSTFYADKYAAGGNGTSESPWTSASGCGGILEAFNAMTSANATLYLRRGYYKIASPCVLAGKSFTWAGDGAGAAFIDATAITNYNVALTVQGSLTALTTTSGATAQGVTSFAVASVRGIAANQWLLIRSATEYWNYAMNGTVQRPYFKGEWQRVKVVSGTTVTPEKAMWDSYLSGTPVSLLNPITVDISGFTILGNPSMSNGMACVVLRYATNSSIHNTGSQNCNQRSYGAYYVIDSTIHNNMAMDYYPTSPRGTNYGISTAMAYNVEIHHNNTHTGRHGMAVGADGSGGVDRMIDIHDNSFTSTDSLACDVHGIAEFVSYHDNRCIGGLSWGGQKNSFKNSYVTHNPTTNLLAYGNEIKSWDFEISGNEFVLDTPQVGGSGAIAFSSSIPSNDKRGNFVFR